MRFAIDEYMDLLFGYFHGNLLGIKVCSGNTYCPTLELLSENEVVGTLPSPHKYTQTIACLDMYRVIDPTPFWN